MYSCHLSYVQLKKYLQLLKEKSLIVQHTDGQWTISERGKEYLGAYRVVKDLIEHDDGSLMTKDSVNDADVTLVPDLSPVISSSHRP
jgi:winged helix-turn-helix protein